MDKGILVKYFRDKGYFSKDLQGYGILNTSFGICNFPAKVIVFYLEVIFHEGIASFKCFLANEQQFSWSVQPIRLYTNAFYMRGMLF